MIHSFQHKRKESRRAGRNSNLSVRTTPAIRLAKRPLRRQAVICWICQIVTVIAVFVTIPALNAWGVL